jgi:hypothetical protein
LPVYVFQYGPRFEAQAGRVVRTCPRDEIGPGVPTAGGGLVWVNVRWRAKVTGESGCEARWRDGSPPDEEDQASADAARVLLIGHRFFDRGDRLLG